MTLYLVTADTYDGDYGSCIECFGIATSEKELQPLLLNACKNCHGTNVPMISKIEANTIIKPETLGGYAE